MAICPQSWGFLYGSAVKNLPANAGEMGLIPGSVEPVPPAVEAQSLTYWATKEVSALAT